MKSSQYFALHVHVCCWCTCHEFTVSVGQNLEKRKDSPRRGGLHCHIESTCTEASPKHKINKVFFDISIYVYLQ